MNKDDTLQLMPVEKWAELQEILKSDWPRSISGYYILEIQRKWIEEGFDYGFNVYCPFGDARNGVVAVHDKGPFYEIFIDCPQNDTKNLEDSIKRTKCIDWKKTIDLMFAASHVVECLKRVVKDIDGEVGRISYLNLYIVEKGRNLFNISLPQEITFKLLSLEHIEMVDSVWPHRYSGSTKYFQALIQNNFGYGLFKKNELVAWTFIKENGALGHIYTLEEHRRGGYGQVLVKLVCNVLLKEGKDVFSYSIRDNVKSCRMHEKIGFVRHSEVGSCYLKDDTLQLMPVEKWAELQEILKSDLPRSISGYYILEIQRKWIEEGFDYGFNVYCPFGDARNGVVAVHDKGPFYEMFIVCPQNDTKNLEGALRWTKSIDWKKPIELMFAESHIVECLRSVVSDIDVEISRISYLNLYIVENGREPFNVSLPPETTFKLLSPEHIELVDSVWPQRHSGSKQYFQTLIQNNFGYGLFKNNELVAWTFIKDIGALGHIYTLEEHRRRGYAETIVKLVCDILLKEGKYVFSYSLSDNFKSCRLHEKIGFLRQSEVLRIVFYKE